MASFESHATTPTLGCLWEARWYSPSECHGDPRAPTVWDFVCQVNHCLLAPTLGCVWEARWYSPSECHGDPRAPTVWDFVCQGERTKPTLGCLREARWYSTSECHGDPQVPTVWRLHCCVGSNAFYCLFYLKPSLQRTGQPSGD